MWISDDGGWTGYGVRIAANNYTYLELLYLSNILTTKFNLDCTIQNIYIKDKYSIYIKNNSIIHLRKIVLPYMHKSMYYKLGL